MTSHHGNIQRRTILKGVAAVSGAALLAACGAESAATTTPAPVATRDTTAAQSMNTGSTAIPATTSAPMTTGGVGTSAPATRPTIEIEVSHFFSNAGHPINELIDTFNKKGTGIVAKGRIDGADYQAVLQKAQASLAAGRPPAIATTAWRLAQYAESALGIVGLGEVGGSEARDVFARYPDNVLSTVTLGSKVIGLPFAFAVPVLYYNQDMFRAAGLDPMKPPATWDEAFAYAEKLKTMDKQAVGFNIDEWISQCFVQCNGGNVLDGNGKVVFDSPEAIVGFNLWLTPARRGYFVPGKDGETRATWNAGNLGMYATSISNLGAFRTNARMQFTTAPFPTIGSRPRRLPLGGGFLGVYAKDRDQRRGAWEFLKFVSSEEGARIWAKVGYVNATKWQVEVLPGQEAAYTQLMEGMTPDTIWPGARGLEAWRVYSDWLQRWTAGASVNETVKQAKADVSALLP